MKNWTVRQRIAWSFGAVIALMIVMGVVALIRLAHIERETANAQKDSVPGLYKTTTLCAALHEINSPKINISTIEDPVEILLEGVNQSQVDSYIDLKFSVLLRSLLRQDPDVILIGEIRDLETAKIATEAALTGHLVFATLHTNSAPQAIVRLM